MKKIENLDIEPFTRKVWWSKKAEEYWADKVHKVQSLHHELQYETMQREKRDVCTVHVKPENFPQKMDEFSEDGVHYFPIRRTGSYDGFAHKHPEPKPGQWNYYGVASTDMENNREFYQATQKGDHDTMGKLLGFPSESREFFQREFSDNDHRDPIWQIEGTEKVDEYTKIARPTIYTNVALRYFGIRWVSCFPHSWKAEGVDELGKKFQETGYNYDEERSEWMDTLLRMPYIWNVYHGVAEIVTPIFKGVTNSMRTKEEYTLKVIPEDAELPKYSRIPHGLAKEYANDEISGEPNMG